MYSCKNNDIRISKLFINPLLEKTKSMKKTPGKRLRYYDILRFFIASNGVKTRSWSISTLEYF